MDEGEQEILIRRYLLGELSEGQQAQIEKRFMTDAEYRELVLMVEGELIDDYANGSLPAPVGEKFAARFLSHPSQLSKVQTAAALKGFAPVGAAASAGASVEPPTPYAPTSFGRLLALLRRRRRPALAFGLALFVLVGVVFGLYWSWERRRHAADERELAELNSPQDAGPSAPRTRTTANSILRTTLVPAPPTGSRPDGTKYPRVFIADERELVNFRLKLPADAGEDFEVAFRAAGGGEMFRLDMKSVVENGERSVDVTVPTRLLAEGVHQFQLRARGGPAREESYEYYFNASRR